MKLPFFGRGQQVAAPAGDRLGKLRKVLSKARIPYSHQNPEAALAHIPPNEIPARIMPYLNQGFAFPFGTTERIAFLAGGFSLPKSARNFHIDDVAGLNTYQAQGLVADSEIALRLAESQNRIAIEHAIVILTSMENPMLPEEERDILWRAFSVPAFEYLRAWDGTVVARECEVHDGLHIVDDVAIPHLMDGELLLTQINRVDVPIIRVRTGLTGELVREHCECGLETPRLRALVNLSSQTVAEAA